MKHLKITARLAISIVFLLLAVIIISSAYIETIANHVERGRLEQSGISYLRPVIRTLSGVAEYHALQMRKQAGDNSVDSQIAATAAEVNGAFDEMKAAHERLAVRLQLTDADLKSRHHEDFSYPRLLELWKSIEAEKSASVSNARLDTLSNSLQQLTVYLDEVSALILDPEARSYYLMDAMTVNLVRNISRISESEANIYRVLTNNKALSMDDKLDIWALASMIEKDDVANVVADFQTLSQHADDMGGVSGLQPETSQKLDAFIAADKALVKSLRAAVSNPDAGHYSGQSFLARKYAYSLSVAGLDELESLISKRIHYYSAKKNTEICKASLAILIGLAFFWYITRGIIACMKKIEVAMVEVAGGNLDYKVPCLDLRDEIGSMARTLELFRKSYWWLA